MSVLPQDLGKEDLVDILVQMIRTNRLREFMSTIDAHEDPITIGTAFNSAVKRLYKEHKDVTRMLAAGNIGLAYCLSKAATEPDKNKAQELKKLGRNVAFNTAVNCWPGWGDDGVVIEKANLDAGIELASKCLNLTQELALGARPLGTAHWLIGALELATHRFDAARGAFEQAERAYVSDETLGPQVLMARGYIALTGKVDPQSPENADTLNDALDRLRSEGSKDAIFFADQIATANRLLFENKGRS